MRELTHPRPSRRALRDSFDQAAWSAVIIAVISARGISDRQAATEAGVACSTITRTVRQDKRPDVDTLVALADWAGVPLELFARRKRPLEGVDGGAVEDARRLLAALRAAHEAAETVLRCP